MTADGHVLAVRVYFEDTDFSGIVYHANFLKFMERGRSDMLRQSDIGHGELGNGVFGEPSCLRRAANRHNLLQTGPDRRYSGGGDQGSQSCRRPADSRSNRSSRLRRSGKCDCDQSPWSTPPAGRGNCRHQCATGWPRLARSKGLLTVIPVGMTMTCGVHRALVLTRLTARQRCGRCSEPTAESISSQVGAPARRQRLGDAARQFLKGPADA